MAINNKKQAATQNNPIAAITIINGYIFTAGKKSAAINSAMYENVSYKKNPQAP